MTTSLLAQGATIGDGQALTALLATEGFLLAAVALSINLASPGQPRARRQIVSFSVLTKWAAIALAAAAVGASSAWIGLFVGGEYEGLRRAIVAGGLGCAIVAQPIIALLLAFSADTE